MKKAEAAVNAPGNKKKIDKIKDDAILNGISNGVKVHTAQEAGEMFGRTLRITIQQSALPAGVVSLLEDYWVGKTIKLGDGKYMVHVGFDKDTTRHTMSTRKEYYPVDIAELYNDGVDHIMKQIFERDEAGILHTSSTYIPGAHFMEQAIIDFQGNYGTEYNVLEITINRESV